MRRRVPLSMPSRIDCAMAGLIASNASTACAGGMRSIIAAASSVGRAFSCKASAARVVVSKALSRWDLRRLYLQAQPLPDRAGGTGQVERVEVQAGRACREQLLAKLGHHVEPE